MNMRLMSLQIRCKRENYLFHFSDNISFIYGNAGVGKSTLLNLVAFALGGQIIKTHVVSDEVLSVYLTTLLNQSITVIDRKINSNIVHIVYQDKDYYVTAKGSHKSGRMSLTEFLCTVCKITPDVLIDKKDNREQSIFFHARC
jgi:predicted ATPase